MCRGAVAGDIRIAGLLAAIDNVSLAQWRQKARELEIDLAHYTVEADTMRNCPGFYRFGNKKKLVSEFNRALSFDP